MKFSNLIWAASAVCLVRALPKPNTIEKRSSGFYWLGCSESGAEWAPNNLPGTLGSDYFWPNTSAIQVLKDGGANIFRVPFLMERLMPASMTGSVDYTYMNALRSTVTFITDQLGAFALIDPHNYGRYQGNIITSTSDFKAFWKTVAGQFQLYDKVIFDTNNEYHDMDQTLVFNLNQAAINGIRSAGATTQYIFVEGNSWSSASRWASVNDNLKSLTDPSDKIVYEMHLYLDSDGSGSSPTCVNSTIGQDRVQSATQWLRSNNKKGFIGEFAGGVNSVCQTAVDGLLSHLSSNSDVWLGASWWAAGSKWGNYMFSIEPTDGTAYSCYFPILEKYFVNGQTTPSTVPSSSIYPTRTTSIPSYPANTMPVSSTSNTNHQYPVPTLSTTSSSAGAKPTIPAVSSPPTVYPTGKSPANVYPGSSCTTSSSVETQVAQHYQQCGGTGWTGPTSCASPYTCTLQNPYYWQCV
ncbi:Glycoside hydrolase superfamily [Elaphomyces granulatus]